MSWIDAVSNPQGLQEIYSGDPPSLVGVDVHGVSIEREGPTLRLILDLPGYPDNPPMKWRRSGFNAIQVELLFGGVNDLSLTGISTEVLADIDIRRDGGVVLDLRSKTMRVLAAAASVTISKVSAYLDSDRDDVRSDVHTSTRTCGLDPL
jgi:hypothetical protein